MMKRVEKVEVITLLEEGDSTSIIIFESEKEFREFLKKEGFKEYKERIFSNGHDLLEVLFTRNTS